jgi:hypothetical protein
MAFKMVLDSLDGLPEEVAKEYVEKDGKFHIQVEGMKTQEDVNRIQQALTAERNAHTELKTKIKTTFGEEKFEDIRQKLDKLPELEAAAAGNLDETKIATIVEGRLKAKTAPLERQLETFKAENTALKEKVATYETKEKGRTIADQIRAEAAKAKMLDGAIEDAVFLGSNMMELQEDGVAVVKAGTPYTEGLSAKDFIAQLQEKKPHWWAPSVGGGAGGNRGGPSASNNPFSHENWNLTAQGKLIQSDRARAEQLAKAAGTTIGGKRPAPKK